MNYNTVLFESAINEQLYMSYDYMLCESFMKQYDIEKEWEQTKEIIKALATKGLIKFAKGGAEIIGGTVNAGIGAYSKAADGKTHGRISKGLKTVATGVKDTIVGGGYMVKEVALLIGKLSKLVLYCFKQLAEEISKQEVCKKIGLILKNFCKNIWAETKQQKFITPRRILVAFITISIASGIMYNSDIMQKFQNIGNKIEQTTPQNNITDGSMCVDISFHNGTKDGVSYVTDWDSFIGGNDIKAVAIRATQAYDQGRAVTVKDHAFETNYNNAKQAGANIGIYHYFHTNAIGLKSAQRTSYDPVANAEVQYNAFKQVIMEKGGIKSFDILPALDFENNSESKILTKQQMSETIASFIDMFDKDFGKENLMIYCPLSILNAYSDLFEGMPIWVAFYGGNESKTYAPDVIKQTVLSKMPAGLRNNLAMIQYTQYGNTVYNPGEIDGYKPGKSLDLSMCINGDLLQTH